MGTLVGLLAKAVDKMGYNVKHIIGVVGVLGLLVQVGLAQNIVFKTSFYSSNASSGVRIRLQDDIDVDCDGVAELFMSGSASGSPTGAGLFFLNPITHQSYNVEDNQGWYDIYPQKRGTNSFYVTMMRMNGLAEWVRVNGTSIIVKDIASNTYLMPSLYSDLVYIDDYDSDGLDDLILRNLDSGEFEVYGIANGNPVSPPQNLDIQVSGDDYMISWDSLPTATAYRVLWSSSIDGVSFTRIGYTTGTTFTHHNRASEPMGFYRVMSEDNGTGVVRMVGQTGRVGQ
ncbi:MAG: hypothetical protein KDC10_10610 [Calditrichaeota bacterium]|nr:hypothetical protein [Calditrichota bacterium]MCB9473155.1 hypothetical protein [Candidatus Delongbacteria bacterium]